MKTINSSFYKILLLASLVLSFISCNRLSKTDIAIVNFELYGDFGAEQSELKLFKVGNSTKARLTTKGVNDNEVWIDSAALMAFNDFLDDLKKIKKSGYCTTTQHCTVYTQKETIEKKNINCKWDGFNKLKNILFKLD